MPAPTETRAVTIHVSERAFAGLIDHGRKAGYTPTFYAQLLFEAAWAARVGKGEDDPLLVACVEKRLARKPSPSAPLASSVAAAPLAPVPVPRVEPVVHEARSEPSPVEVVPPAPSPTIAPNESPRPPSQMIFARLVCREEGVSWAEAQAALAPAYQSKTSFFVLISKVRKLLAAEGIAFEPVGIWGWRVARHCRDAADAFLGRAS